MDQSQILYELINPANKRKYRVIVVGTGLAGASAAATMAELGYEVLNFCYQDTAQDERIVSLPRVGSTPQKLSE